MDWTSLPWTALLGAAAALASMTSFAPQALKIARTRDVSGLSARTYALTVLAFALWLAYGVARRDLALMIPNAACLALSSYILMMTLRGGGRPPDRRR
ncbi:MAG: hypothetical protein KJS97_03590 [Alphaproteobacteria bacterium]|nr:hypothetical protein [Alphaproteobacteria bacterium]